MKETPKGTHAGTAMPTSPLAPTPPEAFSRTWPKGITIAGVIIVLLLIIIAYIPVDGDHLLHRAVAVRSLTDSYITPGNTSPTHLYRFGMKGLQDFIIPGTSGATGDFAENGGTRIAVTANASSTDSEVMLLTPTQKTLFSSSGQKAFLAVSPDGKFAAFSVATSTKNINALSAWHVFYVDVSKGTVLDLGPGVAPQFFMHDGTLLLLSTTDTGLRVTNPTLGSSFTTPFTFKDSLGYIARISPNGTYLAIRDASRNFGLYTIRQIDSNIPMDISPIQNDLIRIADVTLNDQSLFAITSYATSSSQVQVVKIPYSDLTKRKVLYTFPADDNYRFVP